MSSHRCPAFALNSSLLIFAIGLTGCQSQVTSSAVDEQEPTWSFKNITWRTADSDKTIRLRADALDHFGDEIRAEGLTFSYQTPEQSISGSAAFSKSSPELHTIELKELKVRADQFGHLMAQTGDLDTRGSRLNLQDVNVMVLEPRLELTTDSARLTLSTDRTMKLETGAARGSLKDFVEP